MFFSFRQLCLAGFSVLALVAPPSPVVAQSDFAPGVSFTEDVLVENLPPATAMSFSPDGRKLFIALKEGIVRVVENGTLRTAPFLNISSMVNRSTDRGLLAIALHPRFPSEPFVYLFFVRNDSGLTSSREPRVSQLVKVRADQAQGYNVAVAGSLEVLLGKNSTPENTIAPIPEGQPIGDNASCMTNRLLGADVLEAGKEPSVASVPIEDCFPADGLSHTAGTLLFGSDGSLYVSHGDGSDYNGSNRPAFRAQLKDSLAGKILRINPANGQGYPSNPFFDAANPGSNRSRVWAYGLRNPFRITLDPRGEAFMGDVGSSTWEEVNAGKGSNFGWPCYEGGVAAPGTEGADTQSLPSTSYKNYNFCKHLYTVAGQGVGNVTRPSFSYKHPLDAQGNDLGASVTGVAFYSGTSYPAEYRGSLFIADYAQRVIRYLVFNAQGRPSVKPFVREIGPAAGAVQLLTGPDTNIYALYLDLATKTSQIRRFRYVGLNAPPRVVVQANPEFGRLPLDVSFRSDGTSDPDGQPLSYRWEFGDGGVSTQPHPTHRYERVGTFEATLTVRETTSPFLSSSSSVTVRTGVTPPQAIISSPSEGTTYTIGDKITFSGSANFSGTGTVALSWSIIQHHNLHTHLQEEATGPSGSFTALEHADNTYYELCLFADAGGGVLDQTCRNIFPSTTDYTFASSPPGVPIAYVDEGEDVLAPHVAKTIIGSTQTIVAPVNHAGRNFVGWSDGVPATERSFTVGSTPVTFTALYQNLLPEVFLGVEPAGGAAPVEIAFDAAASFDPEGEPLSFLWDFGDGGSAEGASVRHVYTTPGRYPARVTAEDRLAGARTAERTVDIIGGGEVPTPEPGAEPLIPAKLPRLRFLGFESIASTCGVLKRPCAIRTPKLSARASIDRKALSGVVVKLVVERSSKGAWVRVGDRVVKKFGKKGAFPVIVPAGLIRKSGTYGISFEVSRSVGPGVERTKPKHVLVAR